MKNCLFHDINKEMETPLLSENKIGKEFMNKLFEIFPDAQVSSAYTSNNVFEARVTGVQLSHEDLERVLKEKSLRFRIENGNLIATLDMSTDPVSVDRMLQLVIFICVWFSFLILTGWHVYMNWNAFRLMLH